MDNTTGTETKKSLDIVETVKGVILNPVDFYRGMAKGGGFGDPLVFAVVMGVVTGLVQAVLGLLHFGAVASVAMALASIIITPIAVLIFGFVGAAIMFVIWKLMGSNESYETAYRCGAYAAAISPITALLGIIPFAGSLIGLAWMLYLIVTASVEVHKLPSQKAWLVFGIIGGIFALMSISGQLAARRVQRDFGAWQREMGGKDGVEASATDAAKTFSSVMKAAQAQAAAEVAKAQAEAAKAQAEAAKAQAEAAKAARE
ncbi:MAG: YIP1 family protein [bacterium]